MSTKSHKPSRQRKALFNAPLHIKHKMLAAHLSKELRQQYGFRSLPLRKGDTVMVMRGDFKGVMGKVVEVDTSKLRVHVEGVMDEKMDGTKYYVPIHPSNLLITKLDLSDKARRAVIERRASVKGGS
ncbi:MAG: 50S ribosomal protein L24 [Candidatus Nezhaarchaeota archaeon]|nr:50S ribosomal protein L24 [Candidatus Nezhaarchaeota archaeon]